MKKLLFTFLLLALGVGLSEAKPSAYYWVVENTACAQGSSVIRIYNDQHQLIYTETIEGRVLDITNKCVTQQLNRKVRKLRALRG